MRDNFFINWDSDGNMPVLTHNKPCKKHYCEYRNNRPIRGCLPEGEDRIWDFSVNEMFALREGVLKHDGTPMPMVKGFTHVYSGGIAVKLK